MATAAGVTARVGARLIKSGAISAPTSGALVTDLSTGNQVLYELSAASWLRAPAQPPRSRPRSPRSKRSGRRARFSTRVLLDKAGAGSGARDRARGRRRSDPGRQQVPTGGSNPAACHAPRGSRGRDSQSAAREEGISGGEPGAYDGSLFGGPAVARGRLAAHRWGWELRLRAATSLPSQASKSTGRLTAQAGRGSPRIPTTRAQVPDSDSRRGHTRSRWAVAQAWGHAAGQARHWRSHRTRRRGNVLARSCGRPRWPRSSSRC